MQPIEDSAECELMKRMKNHVSNIVIILIDGDGNRDVIARAFLYGVQDAFRRPYNYNGMPEDLFKILYKILLFIMRIIL